MGCDIGVNPNTSTQLDDFPFYGWQRTTLLDYPGKVASLAFTSGCNLACPYCYNVDLAKGSPGGKPILWKDIREVLFKRRNVLKGFCITGGEPLMHPQVPEIISEAKDMGYSVKIDTNGTFPQRLKDLDVDFIAMDIKTYPSPNGKYNYTYKSKQSADKTRAILNSIDFIINSGIDHEFRTVAVEDLTSEQDLVDIGMLVKKSKSYVISPFSSTHSTLDPSWKSKSSLPYTTIDRAINNLNQKGVKARRRNY